MTEKPREDRNELLEILNRLWIPIAGFVGAISLIYNFYNLWQGDQGTITVLTVGVGLAIWVISLTWMGFSYITISREAIWPIGAKHTERTPRYGPDIRQTSRVFLVVTIIASIAGLMILQKQREQLAGKVIVVMAAFDGPEDQVWRSQRNHRAIKRFS